MHQYLYYLRGEIGGVTGSKTGDETRSERWSEMKIGGRSQVCEDMSVGGDPTILGGNIGGRVEANNFGREH